MGQLVHLAFQFAQMQSGNETNLWTSLSVFAQSTFIKIILSARSFLKTWDRSTIKKKCVAHMNLKNMVAIKQNVYARRWYVIENWMLGNQILVYNTVGERSCYFHEELVILNKICFHENCSKLDSWGNCISLVESSNGVEIILVEESSQWRIVQMPNFLNLRSWFHMDCVAECGVGHEKISNSKILLNTLRQNLNSKWKLKCIWGSTYLLPKPWKQNSQHLSLHLTSFHSMSVDTS